ncbi:hypothetical protein K1T71_007805 [Dendrolimus kikuchii]|uniref:Uncharacterized protein n=1 Tax=Dendrolimus kikuchii TaxID=765133 RepID=A0ACC1CY47_9NEOP|nr:hypothetical protein K1T71_007805 [Dendrolimus kikuchii]
MEENLKYWLSQPPTFTTFRINMLKKFNSRIIQEFLEDQAKVLKAIMIPKFYNLSPDCLILEQWSSDVELKQTGKIVIVDALCAAAVLRGAHVFAPGVLGLPSNYRLNDVVDIYGDLEGHCKRGLKINYEGKKVYVGMGFLKMHRHDLFDNGIQPNGIAVHTILPASKLPIVNETISAKGDLVLQNLPSVVCGWVLNAQPYEYILDMCAAPGNKTTHMAEMSNNQAFIWALDKTPQKTEKIRKNCETQGVTCVNVFAFDSTKCCSEDSQDINCGPPFPLNSFGKVLLDAPCSGLGQRPQLIDKLNPKTINSYKFLQRKLFTEAVKVLKVGGTLVYSTCTITVDENEGMVVWALEKFRNLKLVPAEPLHGGSGLIDTGLNNEQRAMVQRFGPDNDPLRPTELLYNNSIGFFIAKFIKLN